MARDNSFPFHGFQVDSDEEVMTILYFEQLQEKGYVEKIERAESIMLSEKLINKYQEEKIMKTKTKLLDKQQILLEEHIYTPEFKITWTTKGVQSFVETRITFNAKHKKAFFGINFTNEDKMCSYFEVKPAYDKFNMTRLFKVNQKMVWKIHNIFVNLIQPHELFKETFTPETWLLTPTGRERRINWPIKTTEQYLQSLNQNNNNDIQNITEGNTGILRELGNEPIIVENTD